MPLLAVSGILPLPDPFQIGHIPAVIIVQRIDIPVIIFLSVDFKNCRSLIETQDSVALVLQTEIQTRPFAVVFFFSPSVPWR